MRRCGSSGSRMTADRRLRGPARGERFSFLDEAARAARGDHRLGQIATELETNALVRSKPASARVSP